MTEGRSPSHIVACNVGPTRYHPVWDLQHAIFNHRLDGRIGDTLLLTEHHHVYTLGKASNENHLLARKDELALDGIDVFSIDRGGDVTYHGPGQLVAYPILHLDGYYHDVHRYLRDLEEVIIRTIAEFGITGTRDGSFTGVWVGNDKIAAIGVKVSHWVTMHGIALNMNTDLRYFDRIIPCGIFHKGVTSMERLLGQNIPSADVAKCFLHHFGNVFNARIRELDPVTFLSSIEQRESERAVWHH